jgi:hypothetical protein
MISVQKFRAKSLPPTEKRASQPVYTFAVCPPTRGLSSHRYKSRVAFFPSGRFFPKVSYVWKNSTRTDNFVCMQSKYK